MRRQGTAFLKLCTVFAAALTLLAATPALGAKIRGRGASAGAPSDSSAGPAVGGTSDSSAGPSAGPQAGPAGGPGISGTESGATETFTVAIAGDLLFDPAYAAGHSAVARGVAGSYTAGALEVMRGADAFIVNNEFTYTRGGTRSGKTFAFRADPRHAAMLQEMGVDLVTLANNHTWDYGAQGLLDTLATLEAAGIPYIGAGRNLADAMRPAVFSAGAMRIAVLNATEIERNGVWTHPAGEQSPGVFRCYDPGLLLEAIRRAKAENDFVIVIPHWGIEGQRLPDARQQSLALQMKEAGADLIAGGHPHVLQSVGFADGIPVAYSLGNFLFHSGVYDTGILEVTFDARNKALRSVRMVPMQCRNFLVMTLDGAEKEQYLARLRNISPGTQIDGDGYFYRAAEM